MLYCEPLLLGMKDHLNSPLHSLRTISEESSSLTMWIAPDTWRTEKEPERMEWIKFKYEIFSAPFRKVIILCLASKHLQALYTHYVVQPKSWRGGSKYPSHTLSRKWTKKWIALSLWAGALSPHLSPQLPIQARGLVHNGLLTKHWLFKLGVNNAAYVDWAPVMPGTVLNAFIYSLILTWKQVMKWAVSGNRGQERLSNLPKITQLGSVSSSFTWPQSLGFY